MRHYIALIRKDDNSDYGVSFPDFPGCVTAGSSIAEAVAMATENPARAIALETKGRLMVGADADLVVLSPQIEVVRTFSAGREVWS